MKERVHPRLTYANVMSTLAVFLIVSGGAAYAAGHLGKNSVGSKQLKKNSVTKAKIKKNAVTSGKVKQHTLTGSDINLEKLGTVPSAQLANAIPPAEPAHLVGAPGEPGFQSGSSNVGATGPFRLLPAGFYKDHEGIVHLQGIVNVGTGGGPISGTIFTLPPGYRPAAGTLLVFEPVSEAGVDIFGSNTVFEGIVFDGAVLGPTGKSAVLDGITYRAES
ncbi:MAG TPA: hypothetical protein VGF04_01000 [Solirubrobacterales bacterium]|jgi:hypothetical protein